MKEVISMSKTFRQYDKRWGNKGYPPRSGCKMSDSGCGPTACADLIVNNPKYKKYTPVHTRKFMLDNNYAVAGQGTRWDGIDACLRHFGFVVRRLDSMEPFFNEMSKSGRKAIILFRSGTKGGITWTSSGHYVTASAYKKVNGKHYLYTRDPGPRCNDGWHCYEDHMRGCIALLWVCYLPEKSTKSTKKSNKVRKKYSGNFPVLPAKGYIKIGDVGTNVKRLQKFLNWALNIKLDTDGVFGVNTLEAVLDFQRKYWLVVDGEFGVNSLAKAKSIKK